MRGRYREREREQAREREGLPPHRACEARDFFIDNLLVRAHYIIEMILVDRPCAMGV